MSSRADERQAWLDVLLEETQGMPEEQRLAHLRRRCAGEPELLAEAEELLRLEAKTALWLETGAGAGEAIWQELSRDPEEGPEPAVAGREIGPWRLLRELGKGGMGTVYLAERADGEFEQTVALKLVRHGTDSEEILSRFELERQILASLHHPNIARLLDGGRTADGQPYFAMEFVEGEPIDRYCDRRRFGIDQRLALFERVGRAVQHAHRNLIVHRDLKPSNIVVTAEGEVKLLDFGIAKMLAPVASPAKPLTRTVVRVLTPEYASPEQVLSRPITTATDVYQLGLLLYELMTGHRAHRLEDSSPKTMEQAICEAPCVPPSAMVRATATPAVCSARRTSLAGLVRRLRGDLDNIVLMALRKEPERRYTSVGLLIEDLLRHRDGLPIHARRDTLGYRVGKFLRRHRAVSAVTLVALVGYAATATWQGLEVARQRDRARAEARKAEEVRNFLVELFEVSDPVSSGSRDVTARELLDIGAGRIETELADEPRTRAEMLLVIGDVYRRLGLYAEAEPLLEKAWELRDAAFEAGDPGVARSARILARLLRDRGEYERAESLLREALAFQRRALAARAPELAAILSELASAISLGRSDYVEAASLLREAVEIGRSRQEVDPLTLSKYLNNLGTTLDLAGGSAGAEAALREALALKRQHLGAAHPGVATTLGNLGNILAEVQQHEEAEALLRQALAIDRRAFGGDHPKVAASLIRLATLVANGGDHGAAEELLREALGMHQRILGEEHPEVARVLSSLASVLLAQQRLAEAEALFRQALEILEGRVPREHRIVEVALLDLGRVLMAKGEPAQGEPMVAEALRIRRALYPAGDWRIAFVEMILARCLRMQGRHGEAEPLLVASHAAMAGSGGAEERELLEELADLYGALGRPQEAARYRAQLSSLP